jgi:methyl-accepting chemotaxis protein
MAEEKSGRERRSWLSYFKVEQDFKQRQIFRLLGLTALNVGVSTVAFVGFLNHELETLRSGLPFLDTPTPSLVRIGIVWAALMAGLGGLFAMLTGMMMTHRMAGPIYSFKRELKRIEEGLPPRRLGVRKGDEFQDVADALNGALEALSSRARGVSESGELALDLERARATHQEILDGLEALDTARLADADRGRVDGWRARMRALRDKLDR